MRGRVMKERGVAREEGRRRSRRKVRKGMEERIAAL
jgi:hypothetical protein